MQPLSESFAFLETKIIDKMPMRHEVPTLRQLAMRIVAWPDGVHRSDEDIFPNQTSRLHESNIVSTLRRRGTAALNVRHKHRAYREQLLNGTGENLVEMILNTWIRLSTFYNTRLDEFQQMKFFCSIGKDSIETLDFLFEGTTLKDGTPLADIAGVLPFTLSPIEMDPYTWQTITRLLSYTGLKTNIKNLHLYLLVAHHFLEDESMFRFGKTLAGFDNLVKLVAHGDANDALMESVGKHCHLLEHLDVRQSHVTEKGVLKLLYKNTDVVKRLKNSNTEYQFPEGALTNLTATLKYFDISTVPYKGNLMERNRAVLFACENLVQTPRRFFMQPEGTVRMFCQMDIQLKDFRNKVVTSIRTSLVEIFIDLARFIWPCMSQGFTHVESRVNANGDEVSLNFYNIDYLVVHMKLEDLVIIDLTVYSANACDFIPLELLRSLTPNLCHLRASIKGLVEHNRSLRKLRTVTAPVVKSKDTLISLTRNCGSLEYLEVRELLHGTDTLTDEDVSQMICEGNSTLEVVRILFENKITFDGLRSLFLECENLRIVGDLSYWDTPLPSIIKLKLNMNFHNFDVAFEYDGILYPTRKPCKEMY